MKKETAQYIIRFDDLCPSMNYENWNKIDKILKDNNVKPIIAVIPNNEDKGFICQEDNCEFWEQIKQYQDYGYMVALHGYNHVYINHKSGIMGISENSEFVGLSYKEQYEKIKNGIEKFNENGIRADAFIAPSHSFDKTTIKVLKNNNIDLISDGFLEYPFIYKEMKWIPCQIWDRVKYREKGLYTVCIHFNNWDEINIENFKKDIETYKSQIISPFTVNQFYKTSILAKLKINYKSFYRKLKHKLRPLLKRLKN